MKHVNSFVALGLTLVAAIVVSLVLGGLALTAISADAAPPSETLSTTIIAEDQNDPALRVGKLLRCPVCQGMPIADSPADMAQTMMVRVRDMVLEGKSEEEILEYFVERYGEWVLLRPKAEGVNWLVWLMPPCFFLLGAWAVKRRVKRSKDIVVAADAVDASSRSGDPYVNTVRDAVER